MGPTGLCRGVASLLVSKGEWGKKCRGLECTGRTKTRAPFRWLLAFACSDPTVVEPPQSSRPASPRERPRIKHESEGARRRLVRCLPPLRSTPRPHGFGGAGGAEEAPRLVFGLRGRWMHRGQRVKVESDKPGHPARNSSDDGSAPLDSVHIPPRWGFGVTPSRLEASPLGLRGHSESLRSLLGGASGQIGSASKPPRWGFRVDRSCLEPSPLGLQGRSELLPSSLGGTSG